MLGEKGQTEKKEEKPKVSVQKVEKEEEHPGMSGDNEVVQQAWASWANLEAKTKKGFVLGIDGGTGTQLEKLGAKTDEKGWTCAVHLYEPELVQKVHESYLDTGVDIIIANTYAGHGSVMDSAGLLHRVEESNYVAVNLAKAARDNFTKSVPGRVLSTPLVAGSISTHPPAIPSGTYHDYTDDMIPWPAPEVEIEHYRTQARHLLDCGVDIIFLEMMKNEVHANRAIKAASEIGLPIMLGLSARVNDKGEVLLWDPQQDILLDSVLPSWLSMPNICGVNVMHTSMPDMLPALKVVRKHWQGVLGAYPDLGTFVMPKWVFTDLKPGDFALAAAEWVSETNLSLIGGCCGIGPDLIQNITTFRLGYNAGLQRNMK